jgi:hypothetical protein
MAAFPFRWLVAVSAVALLSACDESPVGAADVGDGSPVPVILNALAPDPGTILDGVVVTVSGPGISQELVFNLVTSAGTGAATSSYDIPAGPGRVFVAKAFAQGIQTHESDPITADVTRAGLAVDLTLKKLLGAGGVNATIEDFNVEIDDADPFVAVATSLTTTKGATLPLSVQVTYSFGSRKGNPVVGAVVAWASDNPGIVQVASGTCTTGVDGTCSINAAVPQSAKKDTPAGVVASFGGIAHRLGVTVE